MSAPCISPLASYTDTSAHIHPPRPQLSARRRIPYIFLGANFLKLIADTHHHTTNTRHPADLHTVTSTTPHPSPLIPSPPRCLSHAKTTTKPTPPPGLASFTANELPCSTGVGWPSSPPSTLPSPPADCASLSLSRRRRASKSCLPCRCRLVLALPSRIRTTYTPSWWQR